LEVYLCGVEKDKGGWSAGSQPRAAVPHAAGSQPGAAVLYAGLFGRDFEAHAGTDLRGVLQYIGIGVEDFLPVGGAAVVEAGDGTERFAGLDDVNLCSRFLPGRF